MILQSKANSKSLNKISDYCYDYLFTLHLSVSLSKASSDILVIKSNDLPWSFSVFCTVPVVRCASYVYGVFLIGPCDAVMLCPPAFCVLSWRILILPSV